MPQTPASAHFEFSHNRSSVCAYFHVSNPIQLHPALRNNALSLPALWPLRPIPVRPDEPQLPGGFFPVVVAAPTPHRLAGLQRQNLALSPGGNCVRGLPSIPQVLLGLTSVT